MSTSAAIGAIQGVTQILVESNVAIATVFAVIKGIRDAWPKKVVDENGNTVTVPPLPDQELVDIMKAEFAKNTVRNEQLQEEIRAGNLPQE